MNETKLVINELGLLKDYGHLIISAILIAYGILYSHLAREYESFNEDEF